MMLLYFPAFIFPYMLSILHEDSALEVAIRLLPFVIITIAFDLGASRLLPGLKRYMPIYISSEILLTISDSLMVIYLKLRLRYPLFMAHQSLMQLVQVSLPSSATP